MTFFLFVHFGLWCFIGGETGALGKNHRPDKLDHITLYQVHLTWPLRWGVLDTILCDQPLRWGVLDTILCDQLLLWGVLDTILCDQPLWWGVLDTILCDQVCQNLIIALANYAIRN